MKQAGEIWRVLFVLARSVVARETVIGLQCIYLLCAECPADFMYVPSVTGCYKVLVRYRNWTQAGQECQSLHPDAHLLVINDEQEQSAVADMFTTNRQFLFHVSLYCLS